MRFSQIMGLVWLLFGLLVLFVPYQDDDTLLFGLGCIILSNIWNAIDYNITKSKG